MHNPSNDLGLEIQPSFTISNPNLESFNQGIKSTHDENSPLPGFESEEEAKKDDNARKLSIQDPGIVADETNHNLFSGQMYARALQMPRTWYQQFRNKEKLRVLDRGIQTTEENDVREEEDGLDNEDMRGKKENGAKEEVNGEDDVDYDEDSSDNNNLHREENKTQEHKDLNEGIQEPMSEVVMEKKIKRLQSLKEIFNMKKGDRRLGSKCMEKIKKNRNIITVGVVAFSVGLYVSHLLKGNRQEAEAGEHISSITIYMYFK